MHVVAMYSFKGGAGRTVATANIAAQLALMGKRVVCIDFDLDGPGLKIVFGLSLAGHDRYVQDYMNAATPQHFPLRESFLDVAEWLQDSCLQPGFLYLFPASQSYRKRLPDYYDFREILSRIEDLLEWVRRRLGPDIVFLDCASGWRILPKACTQAADHVMTFLRLAKQHILGTVTIARLFSQLDYEFTLLPSAVPQDLLDRHEHLQAYKQSLEDSFPNQVTDPIPEFDRLKWNETPLCLDQDELERFQALETREAFGHIIKCFEKLAQRVISQSEQP